jgi:hypothetical protein
MDIPSLASSYLATHLAFFRDCAEDKPDGRLEAILDPYNHENAL